MSMFNDISWGSKDKKEECESSAQLVSIYARRFSPGRWSFLGLGSEKKWYPTHESKPRVLELMNIKFRESGHQSSDPLVHCPEERSKGKVVENYQYTSALMKDTIETFFRAQLFLVKSSVSTEQSQICVRNANLAMLEQGDLFW